MTVRPTLDTAKKKSDPMREVVGVMVGTTIYRDLNTIYALLRDTEQSWELVTRARMRFMEACDLGPQWKEWANAPTLFIIGKDGNYSWPRP
jgi:hypothetical protein